MKAMDVIPGNAPPWRTATLRAIGRGGEAEREAFPWVAKYEQAFWEMACARGHV